MLLAILPLVLSAALPNGAVSQTDCSVSLRGSAIHIAGATPVTHCQGLKLNANKGVSKFVLDRGIFTQLQFRGSRGRDVLKLGPQAVVVTNSRGLVVDFRKDSAKDVFEFTNTHREDGPPLKHLQRSVIRNMGPEDIIKIQGRKYGYRDVSSNGTLPGIDRLTLRVEKQ